MKKLIFSFSLLFICLITVSQSDTLYLQKNKKVACKIYEINEYEIKYKQANMLDGPTYFIDKSSIVKYCLSNGFCERLTADELSLENEHKEILGNRQVVKIHPFSFAGSHISFAYEKVIKVGMNLDIEAGYINSNINTSANIFGVNNYGDIFKSGIYFKPGVKFFLGQDFSIKGLKYAHPLKGRYIKLDAVIANVNYNNVSQTIGIGYPTYSYQTIYTDVRAIAYGGFVNYGRQFILGNILTLDYYVGVGFTGQSLTYTNPNYNSNLYNYGGYRYNEYQFSTNYYSFFRVPTIGMSFTAGFRIGYIIPEPKQKSKSNKAKVN